MFASVTVYTAAHLDLSKAAYGSQEASALCSPRATLSHTPPPSPSAITTLPWVTGIQFRLTGASIS